MIYYMVEKDKLEHFLQGRCKDTAAWDSMREGLEQIGVTVDWDERQGIGTAPEVPPGHDLGAPWKTCRCGLLPGLHDPLNHPIEGVGGTRVDGYPA